MKSIQKTKKTNCRDCGVEFNYDYWAIEGEQEPYLIAGCPPCVEAEHKRIVDAMTPKGNCENCNTRPATLWWVGEGGAMAWAHGGGVPWCQHCSVTEQLKHARDMAAKIPELEEKLKSLQ